MKYRLHCIDRIHGKRSNSKRPVCHQMTSQLLTLAKYILVAVRFQWPGKMVGMPYLVVSIDLERGLTSEEVRKRIGEYGYKEVLEE